ncbi:MAG: glycoside hydrolase family 32 protein, partial [Methanosarcinaceae archaeon]|nr:glycoside hydrolase family 32 protein [Methanosarcinaceae archaeon]
MKNYLRKSFTRSTILILMVVFYLSSINARAAEKISAAMPPTSKKFTVTEKYLIMPIDNNGEITYIHLFINNKEVRRYQLTLAASVQAADWYAYFTIENYMGKEGRVTVDKITEEGFALVKQSATIPGEEKFFKEPHRPQFHFTQKVGWNNDTNGMVYHNGKYHLFFQHNPVGINWGNMTWGHATSTDLLHWEQQANALFPYVMARGICASGSATVDKLNTAGWGANTLVAFFSDNRTPNNGESIAYSTDDGNTFTYYEKSPFLHHAGRDPKVIWYEYNANDTPLNERAKELGGHWVMAVFDETRTNPKDRPSMYIQFHTSINMRDWTYQDHLLGYFECPELFELPVDKGANGTRWVVFGANSEYQIGEFDGRSFKPDHEDKCRLHYGKYYAAQTFDNTPDGRKIQIGWVRIPSPGPYNQHFSFPHRNTLRTTSDGIRMFAEPIKEITKLHGKKNNISPQALPDGITKSTSVNGRLFDIRTDFDIGTAKSVVISAGNVTITYDALNKTLIHNKAKASLKDAVPLEPINGKITMQILIDNSILEIIGNNGRIYLTDGYCNCPKSCDLSKEHKYQGAIDKITIQANGGSAKLNSFIAYEMK